MMTPNALDALLRLHGAAEDESQSRRLRDVRDFRGPLFDRLRPNDAERSSIALRLSIEGRLSEMND